jgi:hypothetical protein
MKLLFSLLFAASLWAQTVGTIAVSTISTVTATAGPLVCVLTNSTPALPTGIHVACTNSGATVFTADSVVPTGTNGLVGSFSLAGNSVTWIVNQPTGQTSFSWQMAANGVGKSGTF